MTAGKVAVVTGAGSGVGRAAAVGLMKAGYRVALVGRRLEALTTTAAGHGRTLAVPTDITDPVAVKNLFGAVRDTWGRVDVLFNNAGSFGPVGDPDEVPIEDWRACIDVNLTGAFLCAREAFATMRTQKPHGGRIINNGSLSAHVPRPGSIAYTATKHAITGLTKSLSLDGRPYDICCGQIDIGNAATEMTAEFARGARQADKSVRAEQTFDVAHVADAVLYMAGLPLNVNVPSLIIMATGMPFVGRG